MNVVRWSPFREFDNFFQALERPTPALRRADWLPLVDIRETDSNYQIDRKKLATFLPGIVGVLLLPLLWLINEEIFPHNPLAYFHNGELSFFDKLFFVAFLYNMVFYYLIYRGGSVVFNFKSLKTTNSARLLLGLFAFIGFINIYGMLVYGLRSEDHLYYCSFTITLLVVVFFIFSQRYNEFFSDLEDAIVSARYKTSQIQDLDLKKTHLRLIELMNNEKLYLEEGLTLKKAADKLNLKTYQLSEFLNKHLGYNFRQFVNNFRVEKAARMLLEDSEANILSVAYQVGFNSKATFNTAFQNLKGMAPSDYIKLKRASYQEG